MSKNLQNHLVEVLGSLKVLYGRQAFDPLLLPRTFVDQVKIKHLELKTINDHQTFVESVKLKISTLLFNSSVPESVKRFLRCAQNLLYIKEGVDLKHLIQGTLGFDPTASSLNETLIRLESSRLWVESSLQGWKFESKESDNRPNLVDFIRTVTGVLSPEDVGRVFNDKTIFSPVFEFLDVPIPDYDVEISSKGEHWAVMVVSDCLEDKSKVHINPYSEDGWCVARAIYLGLHEICGHVLQYSLWKEDFKKRFSQIEEGTLEYLKTIGNALTICIYGPYQFQLEGLATSLPDFLSSQLINKMIIRALNVSNYSLTDDSHNLDTYANKVDRHMQLYRLYMKLKMDLATDVLILLYLLFPHDFFHGSETDLSHYSRKVVDYLSYLGYTFSPHDHWGIFSSDYLLKYVEKKLTMLRDKPTQAIYLAVYAPAWRTYSQIATKSIREAVLQSSQKGFSSENLISPEFIKKLFYQRLEVNDALNML